jgi:hypothetical protein
MDSLVKIDGKPIEKLIEVVSSGLGTLYRPRAIRKEADAKAYEIRVIEQAKAEAIVCERQIEADYLERINNRLIAKEIQRQNNLDDVVEIAASQLEGTDYVTDEPINKDWATRFFDIVQDVSDEDMQNLWGRILAGEVKQPKSFSLRTLELLRNLSKEEAELFVKIAPFVLYDSSDYFIYEGKNDLKEYGVSYKDRAKLIEIGLIRQEFLVQNNFGSENREKNSIHCIINKDAVVKIILKPDNPTVSIPISCLTRPGGELYKIVEASININMEYLKDLATYIRERNRTAKVQYAQVDDNVKDIKDLQFVDL